MAEQAIGSIAEEFARTFERTWNDRDGAGYGVPYWPDAELVDPMGQIWTGREAIVEMHVDLWRGPFSATTVRTQVRRVRLIAPTVALIDLQVAGSGFPSAPGRSGDANITARLKHVIEKRGGEWKIVASQNTFVAAAAP